MKNHSAIDAEKAIIGCLILEPELVIKISNILCSNDFQDESCNSIYLCIEELMRECISIDMVTIATKLHEKSLLESIGGADYLAILQNNVPTVTNILNYAKIVKDKSNTRDVINMAMSVSESKEESKIENIMKEVSDGVDKIRSNSYESLNNISNSNSVRSIGGDFYDYLSQDECKKIKTSFRDLDSLINGGFMDSEFVIIAARPGMGKTALAINMCVNMAKNYNDVCFISLEMPKKQVVRRIMSSDMEIPYSVLEPGKMSPEYFGNIGMWMDKEYTNRFFVNDHSAYNIDSIENYVRNMKKEKDISVVFIDYIGLISIDSKAGRTEQVSQISRRLKLLAMSENICIIALSQLNRSVESRDDKRPRLSDLRDSGSLEQDADRVFMIYRDSYYNKENKNKNITEISINKNRHGVTGTFNLNFYGDRMLFKNSLI